MYARRLQAWVGNFLRAFHSALQFGDSFLAFEISVLPSSATCTHCVSFVRAEILNFFSVYFRDVSDALFLTVLGIAKMAITATQNFAILAWWNHRFRAAGNDRFYKIVRIVTFVSDHKFGLKICNQRISLRVLRSLTLR